MKRIEQQTLGYSPTEPDVFSFLVASYRAIVACYDLLLLRI